VRSKSLQLDHLRNPYGELNLRVGYQEPEKNSRIAFFFSPILPISGSPFLASL